jgi:hypothetical protein
MIFEIKMKTNQRKTVNLFFRINEGRIKSVDVHDISKGKRPLGEV